MYIYVRVYNTPFMQLNISNTPSYFNPLQTSSVNSQDICIENKHLCTPMFEYKNISYLTINANAYIHLHVKTLNRQCISNVCMGRRCDIQQLSSLEVMYLPINIQTHMCTCAIYSISPTLLYLQQ